jgi:epoxyqueuosine reductase
MLFEEILQSEIIKYNLDFFHFADITMLTEEQNRGFHSAILFGIKLSPEYLQNIISNPNYVEEIKLNKKTAQDEFDQKEKLTDRIADEIASFIVSKGFSAYPQSERQLYLNGCYDDKNHITPLPHKTIALLSGLGWLGKHDLLITAEFGSALSMCTILTNAPLKTKIPELKNPLCGSCTICVKICPVKAISGKEWNIHISRDELVDAQKCTMCMKCLAFCPYTKAYMKKNRILV